MKEGVYYIASSAPKATRKLVGRQPVIVARSIDLLGKDYAEKMAAMGNENPKNGEVFDPHTLWTILYGKGLPSYLTGDEKQIEKLLAPAKGIKADVVMNRIGYYRRPDKVSIHV